MSKPGYMLLSEQCEDRGRKRGRLEQAEETVLNLYKLNIPIETIASVNNVSIELACGWLEKAGMLKRY